MDGTEMEGAARACSGRPPPRLRPICPIAAAGMAENCQLRWIERCIADPTPGTPPPAEAAPQDLCKGGFHPVLVIQCPVALLIHPLIPERWEKGAQSQPTSSLLGPVGLEGEVEDPGQPPPSHGLVSKDTTTAGGLAPRAANGQTRTAALSALPRQKSGDFCRSEVGDIIAQNHRSKPADPTNPHK